MIVKFVLMIPDQYNGGVVRQHPLIANNPSGSSRLAVIPYGQPPFVRRDLRYVRIAGSTGSRR